ncbi:MAG: radical SAM protein [Candidatus Omnitrophica bacterium]|nr:radical SAM protein [Candidatus Omnitrophota bacterium]
MNRIDIKVSFKCNNHCKFCVQGDKRDFCPDKSDQEIKEILKKSRKAFGEVVFTGGELTLRPNIIGLVSFAKGLGYKVQLQTNGRMFVYKDFCRDIIKAGADMFAVSIHGHNARLHDYLTGARGSFQQSSAGIKNILSLGKMVVTNTVINQKNYRFLPEIADFLIDLGVPQYQFAYPHILGNALKNISFIVPRKKEIMPYVKKGLKIGIARGRIVRTEAIPYCLLGKYRDCIAEQHIPETKVFDVKINEDFSRWRKEEGKLKGPNCKKCRYFKCCEGPWREYPEIFGWNEFKPIK